MGKKQGDTYQYQSYLIRMWQDGEQSHWRASAQHAVTGKRIMFNNLEALFLFLYTQTKPLPHHKS